jgi:hypothetical protein
VKFKKKSIWQDSCHIDSNRILPNANIARVCRCLVLNKNQYGKILAILICHAIRVKTDSALAYVYLVQKERPDS